MSPGTPDETCEDASSSSSPVPSRDALAAIRRSAGQAKFPITDAVRLKRRCEHWQAQARGGQCKTDEPCADHVALSEKERGGILPHGSLGSGSGSRLDGLDDDLADHAGVDRAKILVFA